MSGSMKEMRQVAEAYFNVASNQVKQKAREFFNSMDDNNDNRISLQEFVAFMKQEGYPRMNNPYFFKELNRDQSGNLDFWDVMTLYYIVQSGRPFCDGCGVLILNGLYFTCVECFHTKDSTFDLCFGCFRREKIVHGHTNFLDNCALLEATRKKALAEAEATKDKKKESKRHRIANALKWSSHKAATDATTVTPTTASTSQAIVPASDMARKRHDAFKAFELAVGIGGMAVGIGGLAANPIQCSIM